MDIWDSNALSTPSQRSGIYGNAIIGGICGTNKYSIIVFNGFNKKVERKRLNYRITLKEALKHEFLDTICRAFYNYHWCKYVNKLKRTN